MPEEATRVTEAPVPMFYPDVCAEQIEAVKHVLKTRWIGQGPKVDELEEMAGKFFGRPCVAVNSGSAALHLALELVGVRGGEVISPVLTCTATNEMIMHAGAKPVFGDIQKDTLNMCYESAFSKITPATKALMLVHLNGDPCDLKEFRLIAKLKKLPIIEDCAQALFAMHEGRYLGELGDFACFSFQAVKHLTTGDGGLLVCPDEATANKARKLRWFGIDRKSKREMGWQAFKNGHITFDITDLGYKYQMTDIAAAMALAGWEHARKGVERRAAICARYRNELTGVGFFREVAGSSHSAFPIRVERRDDFMQIMESRGVETSLVQVRNDLYTLFKSEPSALYNMTIVQQDYVYLPCHPRLTDEEVDRVIQSVNLGW